MLVHIKPIIYLLLLRLKSLLNSFQLELGALSIPSQVREKLPGVDLPCAQVTMKGLPAKPGSQGARVRMCLGGMLGLWFPGLSPAPPSPPEEPAVSTGEEGLHYDT